AATKEDVRALGDLRGEPVVEIVVHLCHELVVRERVQVDFGVAHSSPRFTCHSPVRPDRVEACEESSEGNASASRVATSATRRSEPFCFTPSSSMIVQKGHATASVEAPVAAASRARSSLIWLPRSSIHMCPPPAPQQNVRLALRAISRGFPTLARIS